MAKDCLSAKKFLMVANFIQEKFGIKMPSSKEVMVSSRLHKRMTQVGCTSLDTYVDYVFNEEEGLRCELKHLVDALTTNKTNFFREASHFDILCDKILPKLCADKSRQTDQTVRIWSSACSTGEEPYTLAMVLSEYAAKNPRLRFSVLASDICTEVLKKAARGIYSDTLIADIPLILRKKYLLKSKGQTKGLVQFKATIRKSVSFKIINLMEDYFGIKEKMDIIFCRNVLIYFDRKTQETLMARFARQLRPGGVLFIGHAESLNGMDVPFSQLMPTVYRKSG